MMSPIISISGLFTFGWTGSVLVGLVTSLNQLRDRSSNSGNEANPRN